MNKCNSEYKAMIKQEKSLIIQKNEKNNFKNWQDIT
jgi:hypothetical protein